MHLGPEGKLGLSSRSRLVWGGLGRGCAQGWHLEAELGLRAAYSVPGLSVHRAAWPMLHPTLRSEHRVRVAVLHLLSDR